MNDNTTTETDRVVEFFLQTQQPDGSWNDSSSRMNDVEWARERLATRRVKMPQWEHRIAWRATSVSSGVLADGEPPAVVPSADRAALRDRIAKVARTVPLRLGPNAVAMAQRGETIILNLNEADDLADAVLAVLPAPADRAAVLAEVAATLKARHCSPESVALARRLVDERLCDGCEGYGQVVEDKPDGGVVRRCRACNGQGLRRLAAVPAVGVAADTTPAETRDEEIALLQLTLNAVEEGRRELRSNLARIRARMWTLTAMLDELHTLLATSSRDWQTYRVDAWLWAVLVGWDCEQPVHDETCTHGAMEEMQQRHGWDDDTVAKARRYRAAVHTLTAAETAAEAQPTEESGR